MVQILEQLGENIRLARLRQKLTTTEVAERARISRSTLWQIEKGQSTPSIGAYTSVLFVLGLEKDLGNVALDDKLGRQIQDAELKQSKRKSSDG
jgi:transcriptional regulator with XRE-family HTH domain